MWFLNMLNDQNNNNSSKRFIAFIAFIQVLIMANRVTWGTDVTLNTDIWYGMIGLVASGIGFATLEFFKTTKKS